MSDYYDVAVIGLGAMGWGGAMSLIREGYYVHGVDVRADVLERFEAEKGKPHPTAASAAKEAPVVLTFVLNDAQTEDVLFGPNGAVEAAKPDTLFILSSTIAPSTVERIAGRLAKAGMQIMDAPVAGGAARALRGDLAIMASGSAEAFRMAEPVFDAIAARVFPLGARPGMASRFKMLNQLLSDVHLATTAEAMTLAAKIGVDLQTMYEVITSTTGSSWMFEERGTHIVNGDYAVRSTMDTIVKDLGIVSQEAEAAGAMTPLTNAALTLFTEAAGAGFGKEDGSAVARYLAAETDTVMPE